MSTAEQIYELVQKLPAFRQVEILDFASYIESKVQLQTVGENHLFSSSLAH